MMVSLKSNEYWGRQSGLVKTVMVKGVPTEERSFKQGQWGHGASNGTRKKKGERQIPIFGARLKGNE